MTIAAEAGADLGGVQLWEGGPYWAECNVGASAPEESGYYFWWGDTVGYTNTGSGWISVKDGTSISFFSSGTAASTYGKSVSTLQSEGWIDSSGNLTAAHDAATAHLGAPWRMPTDAEHSALINNCDWTWTAKNGVNGYEVRGRGDYANRSIFLPAAGYGRDSSLYSPGSHGDCWSSTSYSGYSYDAWYLYFHSGDFDRDYYYHGRYYGQSVRPVRGFAGCSAGGVVTYDAPIIIESVAVWNEFCAAVADGLETEGVVVLLANDVGPVSTTVGTAEHPFAGVFDGGSNTLTVALSGSDRAIAPFSAISGATIRNLKVAGTVSCAIHCSGLVGEVFGGPNLIEGCEVAAAITCSASHFGGSVGHGVTYAVTLRGCVFSGSLSGGTYVATFNGWSDNGATVTLIDCLDTSTSRQPIGRGTDAACVSNTYYLTTKDFSNGERLWSEGKRGKRAYAVTGGEGVTIGFGAPAATYGTTGITAYPTGLAYRGSGTLAASSIGTFYAAEGDVIPMDLAASPTAGDYAASAGTLTRSGNAWTLTMPGGPVVVNVNDTFKPASDAQFPSLVLLDGVPLPEHERIYEYDPLLVERVVIYPHSANIGFRTYSGIVNFVTYKHNLPSYSFGNNTRVVDFQGESYPVVSYMPDTVSGVADLRQTVFWHPLVELAPGESRVLDYCLPSYEGRFKAVVEGFDADGNPQYVSTGLP